MQMIVFLSTKNTEFQISFPGPTEEELAQIDGPDMEGQTTPKQVFCDRKIEELRNALMNYEYTMPI
jgi:hypothetical protein